MPGMHVVEYPLPAAILIPLMTGEFELEVILGRVGGFAAEGVVGVLGELAACRPCDPCRGLPRWSGWKWAVVSPLAAAESGATAARSWPPR
jgi:hypothetical protein